MKMISIDKNLFVRIVANNGSYIKDDGAIVILLYLILCALLAMLKGEEIVQFEHALHKETK